MDRNVRIAKELVRIAKSLVAFRTDEGWEETAGAIADKIEKDILKKNGWKKKELKITNGNKKSADLIAERDTDKASDWKTIDKRVDLDFGRYGGHYLCVFDTSEEGHIIIRDTSGGDYNDDDRITRKNINH